jgi:threonine synthase
VTHATVFTCVVCGREYPLGNRYVCDDHGREGILDVGYDYDAIRASWTKDDLAANPDPTMWRYRPLMPVEPDAPVPALSVGGTPMYDAPRLADAIGVAHVWVKDEGRQPTASLKDRASSMAVAKAMEFGVEIVTTASTGNAAAALSGVAASVGLSNVIFVPETAPEAKVAQLLAYGSKVVLVQGNYDAAFELCLEAADRYGWYNRNTGFNPFMTEGKKTAMLELLEQLGWEVPDTVFVSVGDGSIIGGLHKGAKDLFALGWIDRMPRIFGIQSAGSDYLVQAFEYDEDVLTKAPISADTVADSISADLPRDRIKAMAAVRETDGAYLRVSDDDILAAIPEMARGAAVFGEPAGAAAWAGAKAAATQGLVGRDDTVAVLNTGSGLKDVPSVMRGVEAVGTTPLSVAPDIDALDAALQHHEE